MNHDDDSLILYYYDESLSAAERAAIASALRDDATLATRYRLLCAQLERLREAPGLAPPPAALHRWQTSLQRAARLQQPSPPQRWRGRRLWAGLGFAALTVLSLGLVWQLGLLAPPHSMPTVTSTPTPTMGTEPATNDLLRRGVQSHLRETESRLDSLVAVDAGARRAWLSDVIERHRAYRRAAQDQDASLARVLRAFEPNLLRLTDAGIDAAGFLNERDRLAFELDVVQHRLAHDSTSTSIPL